MSDQNQGPASPMEGQVELRTSGAGGEIESSTIEEPMRLVRVGSMLEAMRAELHELDPDEVGRERLVEVYRSARAKLAETLSGPLAEELDSMIPALEEEPTTGELRVAHAQLLGWLQGLLQGIQTAIAYQQQTSQSQLAGMQQSGGPGGGPKPSMGGGAGGSGQYL
ncbi:MAG: hypothetical protein BRC31_01535 [Actinobacteria bacterium QS_5_72_10]|nr:MAG: hypothetical protein BRC31_01535 [Actinobacteria bacterium QS_5_72_10]